MSTLLGGLIALAASGALLAVLALRDPKRLRNLDPGAGVPMSKGQRRLLGWLVLLPGLVLGLSGQWPALLIWLGASCSVGWLLTQWLAPGGDAPPDPDID